MRSFETECCLARPPLRCVSLGSTMTPSVGRRAGPAAQLRARRSGSDHRRGRHARVSGTATKRGAADDAQLKVAIETKLVTLFDEDRSQQRRRRWRRSAHSTLRIRAHFQRFHINRRLYCHLDARQRDPSRVGRPPPLRPSTRRKRCFVTGVDCGAAFYRRANECNYALLITLLYSSFTRLCSLLYYSPATDTTRR